MRPSGLYGWLGTYWKAINATNTGALEVVAPVSALTKAQIDAVVLGYTQADAPAAFWATDKGQGYLWNGIALVKDQTYTNGGAHVRTIASDVQDPATWYLEFIGTAGAADNAVIYQSGDVSMYNYHTIEVTGTDAADVFVSVDGTNFVGPVGVRLHDDLTTGGGIDVITIPTGDIGILRGKYKAIKVQQDGATDANCRGAHGVI